MEPKQQIVTKARDLFMRYGIKSISMDDLARELGMSKKTVYQYVENKADLIQNVFENHLEEEKQVLAEYRLEAMNAIDEMLKIARHMIRELRTYSVTVLYDLQKYYRGTWQLMSNVHEQHFFRVIKDNLDRGIAEGVYRQDMNPDIVARLYISKSSSAADQECFPLTEYPVEELFIELMNYHLHGIVSQKGRETMEEALNAWVEETK
ncbi:MAG: TetR/AcrR family transcriptional regulator [Saprospiraceae bacterium]|nr:TetR/AcrR family transcriptional regulator [Saprospiraceae bacterium]